MRHARSVVLVPVLLGWLVVACSGSDLGGIGTSSTAGSGSGASGASPANQGSAGLGTSPCDVPDTDATSSAPVDASMSSAPSDASSPDASMTADVGAPDAGPWCAAGQLLCAASSDAGEAGAPRCVEPKTDNANCGACGHACAQGTWCAGGACVVDCRAGQLACGSVCVDPAKRFLDQSQLDGPGKMGLTDTQIPGESFTVGAEGTLTGIEVGVGPCNGADTTGRVQLEVFDGSSKSLGKVSIPESSLPDVCGGRPVTLGAVGAGYFDLTPLCLHVTPGQKLTFVLSLVGGTVATCDSQKHKCSNSGNFCSEDFDCNGFYYVGMTNCGGVGCTSSPSRYTGGSMVFQDATTKVLSTSDAFELVFKTFVQ